MTFDKKQVGHELAALSPARTFDSLVNIIEGQNVKNAFTLNQTTPK